MIRLRIYSLAVGFGVAFNISTQCAESQPGPAPDFREVYDLVREHLAGVSEAELNRAAVEGLLSVLGPKVTLLAGNANDDASAQARLTSRSTIIDGQIEYVRIVRIGEGLDKTVRDVVNQLSGTNELNGIILDLRFTGGDDYAAAAATADLFLKKERPLLDWGQGVVQSKEKADAFAFPVAVLVNHQTAGAAEALAAVLRETGASLILGNKTAGQAMIAQEYALKNGDRLRIASSPVHLGDGSTISSEGLKPDITVAVSPLAEQSYYADAYREVIKTNTMTGSSLLATNPAAATNRTRRPRFNEAELVRERKLGIILDSDLDNATGEPERPMVQDPVLARALDVLKGLSVVRQSHS